MKITCQACHAKYTIADEKVLGKVVKIRCKKCGATIVVDGNDPAAHTGSSRPPPPSPSFEHAAHGQRDTWTVNVGDADQRAMTAPEVVAAYRAGHVNDETFCWKDGMSDWVALREIESLHAACTAPRARAAPEPPANEDELPTRIQDTAMMLGAVRRADGPSPQGTSTRAATDMNGRQENAAAASIAGSARRAGGRSAAADLFGVAAHAGGEHDVLTSAPARMPSSHDDGQKATGARNENSVLFSLTALSKGPTGEETPSAIGEASGLIDIRQLSAQLHEHDDAKRSRVEDIMNLGGGGAFNPALAAPILAAPPINHFPSSAPSGSGRFQNVAKGKPVVFFALGAGAFVIVAAIGAATVLTRGKEAPASDKEAVSASAGKTTPLPEEPRAPGLVALAPPPPEVTAAARENVGQPSAAPPVPALPKTAPANDVPKDLARAQPKEPKPVAVTPAKEAAPAVVAAADQPFNMGEAKARLAAIAGSVQSCKKGDVAGTGRVVVTFAPSGQVQSANLSGPPFEGTPAGACVATRFRGARVPAFTGSPFTVSKSFTIN